MNSFNREIENSFNAARKLPLEVDFEFVRQRVLNMETRTPKAWSWFGLNSLLMIVALGSAVFLIV